MVLKGYALSDEAARLVVILVLIHNIFNALFYPLSGALANGLRAAGDVKFTMYVSVFSTIGCGWFSRFCSAYGWIWGLSGLLLPCAWTG